MVPSTHFLSIPSDVNNFLAHAGFGYAAIVMAARQDVFCLPSEGGDDADLEAVAAWVMRLGYNDLPNALLSLFRHLCHCRRIVPHSCKLLSLPLVLQ